MLRASFSRDNRGGVAPLLALGIIPLIGAVGAAVDYSRANAAKAPMQAALDATSLVLARSPERLSQATDHFNANFGRPDVQNVQITPAVSPAPGGNVISLSANAIVSTKLVGLLGISNVPVTATSSVWAASDGLGCVLSLDPRANDAIVGQGSTTVTLKGCSLYDNSTSQNALTVSGSAKVSALSVGVVGGITPGSYGLITDQGIRTGIGPVKDPYADVALPEFSGCTKQNFKAHKTQSIGPGVYCGGISVNGGVELTLNPGIYYIDGGDLSVNGGASLLGSGVTMVFTAKSRSDWATASFKGNAKVYLTPPKSGPTAGIVMFGDRRIPSNSTFKFTGGAGQYLGGAIYLPSAAIEFAGGSATSTSCTQIIGNTITFTGKSDLAINCSSYEIKPFSSWVVRITS